jgi:3-hydroxybutyryl-CoA dehydrogenase
MKKEKSKNIMVVGAGLMGHSIALVFAKAGFRVNLVDVDQKALQRAMGLIETGLDTLADLQKIAREKIPSVLSRINPSTDLAEVAGDADFVIEAVPEIPDLKRDVFSQLERFCPNDTVLASNTSGLDIFSIMESKNPERFVITHFFAPAHIIPLVEVVPGPKSSPNIISATKALLKKAGKEPVLLNAFVPSFIVNRIQNAIGMTVQEMLEKGWASPEDIDRAVKLSLGIRLPIVGVVQTVDFNGIDVVCDIFRGLSIESAFFEKFVEQGRLGVKTSKGVYDYGGRTESEILKKRDMLYIKMLDYLKEIDAFEPV